MNKEDSRQIIEAMNASSLVAAYTNDAQIKEELEHTIISIASRRFYETIDANTQTIEGLEREIKFTPRRILRNHGNYEAMFAGTKRAMGDIAHKLGAYSSTRLARDLRTRPELLSILEKSPSDYSLLGKLEITDTSNPNNVTRSTTPVLIIPEISHLDSIVVSHWELSHGVEEVETGLGLLKRWKRTSNRIYEK